MMNHHMHFHIQSKNKNHLLPTPHSPQSGHVCLTSPPTPPPDKGRGQFPVCHPGQRSSSATPRRALSMCIPHPAQVALPHVAQLSFQHILLLFPCNSAAALSLLPTIAVSSFWRGLERVTVGLLMVSSVVVFGCEKHQLDHLLRPMGCDDGVKRFLHAVLQDLKTAGMHPKAYYSF